MRHLIRPCIAAFAMLLCLACVRPALAGNLWDGEDTRWAAGYPFITKLMVVDPAAPLVVFSPGRGATARLAYGGHPGGTARDFLAYWLNRAGYNFLGVSYPVFTESGAFATAHPDFTIPAWGRGTAELTRTLMAEHGLTGPVIHAGWSMGGKAAQPFATGAAEIGLEQDFFVSLAATPPIPGLLGMHAEVEMHAPTGLAKMRAGAPYFARVIARKSAVEGRTIIPAEVLARDYLGHAPVQLQLRGLRYDADAHAFTRDHWAEMQESRFFDYPSFPLIATIVPTDKSDARHAMTDETAWGFYLVNALHHLARPSGGYGQMSQAQFQSLATLTRAAPARLSKDVAGGHFFFIGERGARETARAIVALDAEVAALRDDLRSLIVE